MTERCNQISPTPQGCFPGQAINFDITEFRVFKEKRKRWRGGKRQNDVRRKLVYMPRREQAIRISLELE